MSQLTLQLPETLYCQLEVLAQSEGIQLTQYVLYALTRQVSSAYTMQVLPGRAVEQQVVEFERLRQKLGKASATEVDDVLSKCDLVEPEPELSPEIVKRVQALIAKKLMTHEE